MTSVLAIIAPFVALLTHYFVQFSKNRIARQIAKTLMARMTADFKKGMQHGNSVPGSDSSGGSGSGSSGGTPKP